MWKSLIKQSGFSPIWKNKTLVNFDKDREPEAIDIIEKYIKNWQRCQEAGFGLFFQSAVPGVGKTHLAWATMIEILIRYPYQAVSEYTGRIKEEYPISAQRWDIQTYIDALWDKKNLAPYINETCNVELLIIDDLGKEKKTEYTETEVRKLINTRYERGLVTFFTTLLSDLSLIQRLGRDVFDRVMEKSKVIEMESKSSYRLIEGNKLKNELGF